MNYVQEYGRNPMQEALDRNQAESCCQGECRQPEQGQAVEMMPEREPELFFTKSQRRTLRFAVNLDDAFKP